MNQWNTPRRCLVAGVIAVGMLVVPQAALAEPGHCCLLTGGCVTIYHGDSCSNYDCVSCGLRPCFAPSVQCGSPTASDEPDEGTADEADSSASQPEADASVGKAHAESGAKPTRGAADPTSTDTALDPAPTMDHDAGVCIGDAAEDLGSATPQNASPGPQCNPVCPDRPGCTFMGCCCWLCSGRLICQHTPLPE